MYERCVLYFMIAGVILMNMGGVEVVMEIGHQIEHICLDLVASAQHSYFDDHHAHSHQSHSHHPHVHTHGNWLNSLAEIIEYHNENRSNSSTSTSLNWKDLIPFYCNEHEFILLNRLKNRFSSFYSVSIQNIYLPLITPPPEL